MTTKINRSSKCEQICFLSTHHLFDHSSDILKGNALQQPSESNALSGWLLERYEATNTISQVN